MSDLLRDPQVVLGMKQIVPAALLAVCVLGLSYARELELEKVLGIALVRALVQVVMIGSLIGVLLTMEYPPGVLLLAVMIVIATWISKKRGADIPNAFRISLMGIGFGAGLVILLMTLSGTIQYTIRNLIPVGSMIIANAMKTNSLVLDRLREEFSENRDRIEVMLSLGVSSRKASNRFITKSVRASLIPIVESMKSLGVVFIPGMMSGMILSGANPIYAAEYQFIIMAMLFSGNGITSIITSYFARRQLFTEAEQLRMTG